jgi:glutaredoxin
MKKVLLGIILLTIAFILPTYAQDINSEYILFTSETCSHCEDVKQHIADNSLEEVLNIEILEVTTDEDNFALYESKVAECELSDTERGVPMLYVDNRCYVSSVSVKSVLNSAAGVEDEGEAETVITGVDSETENEPSESLPTEIPENNSNTSSINPTQTLNEALYGTEAPQSDFSFIDFLLILLPITIFGAIGYLLITKFKL